MNTIEKLVSLYCEFEKSKSPQALRDFKECLFNNTGEIFYFFAQSPFKVCTELDKLFEKYKKGGEQMSVPIVRFVYCTGNEYVGYRVIVEHDGKFYTAKNGELIEPFMVKGLGKEFQLDCPYVCKIMKQRTTKDSKDWELSYIMQSNTDFWVASYNRDGILTNVYRAAKEYEKREGNSENPPKLP